MGILKNLFGKKEKTDDELKAEVLIKATEHWNATNETKGLGGEENIDYKIKKNMPAYESNDKIKKKNIRAVLLDIASRGEAGVLAISVSDKVGISQIDTSTALAYLIKNDFVEMVNSAAGKKYYLTEGGRKYCISKEFNSEV